MSAINSSNNNIFSTQHAFTKEADSIVRKIHQTEPNAIQYDSVSEMDPSTITALNEAMLEVAQTEKYSIVAQGIVDKHGAALVAMDDIMQKTIAAVGAINGYNPATMTPEKLSLFKATLHDCLETAGTQLNARYANGYIFTTPKNESIQPVDKIVITTVGNRAPDGSLTDSFVNIDAKSEDKIVEISGTTSIGTAIAASDPAFVNIIGGIWGILNSLTTAQPGAYPNLPQTSIDTLNNGTTALGRLIVKVKDKHDLAQQTIVENQKIQDDAKQNISNMKIDSLNKVHELQRIQQLIKIGYALETMLMRDSDEARRTIAAAAA